MSTYVHTLGDSTLDNLYWMLNQQGVNAEQAKRNSVEGQLQERLNSNGNRYQVMSHAYDGFTTSSVLNGDSVGRVLRMGPGFAINGEKLAYLRSKNIDPASPSYFVHPLNNLKAFVNQHPKRRHYAVISVGGNDFRERLHNPIELLREIPRIHERYLQIVQEIKSLKDRNVKPILMFQYRLDVHHDHYSIYTIFKIIGVAFIALQTISFAAIGVSLACLAAKKVYGLAILLISSALLACSHQIIPLKTLKDVLMGKQVSMATLDGLMETFYGPILEQAKIDGIPILDLPNTFNPYDSSLYIAQIEPSQKGGALIAEGIDHIIKHHDFSSSTSMIYSKKGDNPFAAVENQGAGSWSVA